MRLSRICLSAVVLSLAFTGLAAAGLAAAAPARLAVAVSGKVQGPDRSPLPGARVRLLRVGPHAEESHLELEGKDGEASASATTGADGTFLLEAPEPAMWKILVDAKGLVPQEILLLPLVEDSDLPPVELERDAGLEVRVAGPDGKPLSGARVRAEPRIEESLFEIASDWKPAVRFGRTDDKGVAVLSRSTGERLLVMAGADGLPFAEEGDVRGGSVALRLAAGTPRKIRVLDAAGKPAPGIFVRLGDSEWCAGRTADDGLFVVPVPAGAPQDLLLIAEDGRRLETSVEPVRPEKTGEAKEEEPLVLKLPALRPADGRVVSAAGGPVAGALVWGLDPGAYHRSGADGSYRLDLLPGYPGVFQAAARGYLPAEPQMNSSAVAPAPALVLQPSLVLSGVVVNEEGRPLSGVRVRNLAEGMEGMAASFEGFGGAARSGPSGQFRIPGVEAGLPYGLRFSKTGYAPEVVEVPPLEPGAPAPELRVVLRQGRTVLGRVMNEAHEPIPGAAVILRPSERGMEAEMRLFLDPDANLQETATGADGVFKIRDVPAGSYDLVVKARGYAPSTLAKQAIPAEAGTTDLGMAILIPGIAVEGRVVDPDGKPVAGAEVTLLDSTAPMMARFMPQGVARPAAVSGTDGSFRIEDRGAGEKLHLFASRTGYTQAAAPEIDLPAQAPVVLVLKPAATLEGRTVGPDGEPVPHAMLLAFAGDPSSFTGDASMMMPVQGQSDERGSFRIEGVPAGAVRLQAAALGRQRASLELELRPGQVLRKMEVVLPEGAVIAGRVFSPSGEPVAGADLTLQDGDTFFVEAHSDADGRYRLEGVSEGDQIVAAVHPKFQQLLRNVDVRAGENTLDLTFEGNSLEIRGRVVDQDGQPVANARVFLESEDMHPAEGRSGADGAFALAGVEDGTYEIFARKQGLGRSTAGQEVVVDGSSIEGVELRLAPGRSITGKLLGLDAADLAEAEVRIMGEFFNRGDVSPDGTYRLEDIEAGEVHVIASVDDGARQARGTVQVAADAAETRLDLDFGKGSTLTGRVLHNGAPVADISVLLTLEADEQVLWADTDRDGRFRIQGIDPGRYVLIFFGEEDDRRYQQGIDIQGDQEIQVELSAITVATPVPPPVEE